jgi:glycosyltransferase involved in cell wall biosynthesis
MEIRKNRRLKIAIVIPPHVATQSFVNLAKVYSHIVRKYNAEITVFLDKKLDLKFKNLRIKKVFGLDNNLGLYKILFFLGFPRFYYPKLVKELEGFDVIESSTPEFYIYTLQSYHAAKKYNARLVLRTSQTYYNFYLFPYTKFIALFFARKACRFASSLCFTNPQSKEAYFKIGLLPKDMRNSKKIKVTGHAINTKIFIPMNLKKSKRKTILLSVATLLKIKGHQNIIKAVKSLVDKNHKNIELWIVGKGDYEKGLKRLVKNLGISKYIKFLGPLSHEQLVKVYNKSNIFVLGNLHDVTPAVSEAMLCNLPVVASKCGGVDFVIPSEKYGVITKYNDAEDLARGIEKLMLDKKLQKRLIKNARKYILKNFSIEKVAERLYSAYTSN